MAKHKDERKQQRIQQQRGFQKRQASRSFQEEQEVQRIKDEIAAGAPAPGSNPLTIEDPVAGSYAGARTFDELPISELTKAGLKQAGYITLTAIQRAALPHALCGRDVLGAAKTGSGKTLSFLIPVGVMFGMHAFHRYYDHSTPSCIVGVVSSLTAQKI